ncbi:MAG: PAS domain-containing protein, partial [Deltaproteobacteria bacterium]|nr:PAS domain-containing protein [Deltaproteobacteria bacterium]
MTVRAADPALVARIAHELPVGIWVAEVEAGHLAYANDAFERILGAPPRPGVRSGEYTARYGIYNRLGEPYPEDRLPFARALREGTTVVIDDIVIHRADGTQVCVRANARPLRDPDGRTTHVMVAFIDITKEVEAEERLRTVISGASVALFAFDRDLRYTVIEGQGFAVPGVERDAFLGRTASEAFPHDPSIAADYQRVLAGESITTEVALGPVVFESRITPQRDASGRVVGGIGVASD